MTKILVIAEHEKGAPKKLTLNTLEFARQVVAHAGGSYDLAVLGSGVGGVAQALTGYGADAVYVADHPDLAHVLAGPYAKVIADLAQRAGADLVCMSASSAGKDVLPRVAVRLQAGMASDVVGVVQTAQGLAYRRPMWAGNLTGDVVVETPVQVVSVRASAFDALAATGGASPLVEVAADPQAASARVRYVGFEGVVSSRPDLAEASVVVAGGRGLKDRFNQITEPLADLLGGAIGASRAAVDDGYAPNDYQVGQTGKVVAPQLYFAIAISGAVQHLAGMKNSKVIVAINKNADEPIFKVADYGLVADAFVAVPELVGKIKALRA
ncbi:MAG: electron transfer flavoprotein subunit alpha/FixB family protein [Deltaproteobacteria bacterium]|nr:electron transfer flavoprotein subunit alpha/FixB family protein [Deltaproteobacteria bacterium]